MAGARDEVIPHEHVRTHLDLLFREKVGGIVQRALDAARVFRVDAG